MKLYRSDLSNLIRPSFALLSTKAKKKQQKYYHSIIIILSIYYYTTRIILLATITVCFSWYIMNSVKIYLQFTLYNSTLAIFSLYLANLFANS